MRGRRDVYVYLCLQSNDTINSDEIMSIVKNPPSNIEIKGDYVSILNHKVKLKWNRVKYCLPVTHGFRLDRVFKKLIRLVNNPKQLGEYCIEHNIGVFLYIVIEGFNRKTPFPYTVFNDDFITFIRETGAEVDFDVYVY